MAETKTIPVADMRKKCKDLEIYFARLQSAESNVEKIGLCTLAMQDMIVMVHTMAQIYQPIADVCSMAAEEANHDTQ